MRKNDARKWLHAALDLLPVILIPVFMIYSHRHTLTERTTVDIQYKYQTNEVNSYDDLVEGNIYHCDNLSLNGVYEYGIKVFKFDEINNFDASGSIDEYVNYEYNALDSYLYIYMDGSWTFTYTNPNCYAYYIFDYDVPLEITNCDFIIDSGSLEDFVYMCEEESNVITSSDFDVIESVDVDDSSSSIMTVFMDDFNHTIDTYFNMGNVFNLNGVYQWFNTNIFGGNAPTIIYSVWNIALYELVMDLLFLLYGLFMFFIDMCEKLMQKPFDSVK